MIPILTTPYISGVDFPGRSLDWNRAGGIGDIDFVTLLSPNLPGTILGFGPTFIFPTATNYNIGQGKFQVGPTVVGFITKNWVGVIFAQNWWSVSGTPRKPAVNQMNTQYVLVRMLPGAWQIQMTPNILVDWNARKLGNAVTFPLGIGVGRTFRINPQLPPISTALEFQWMPVYPEDFGQRFNIQFNFKPVLPNLVKKPIFE